MRCCASLYSYVAQNAENVLVLCTLLPYGEPPRSNLRSLTEERVLRFASLDYDCHKVASLRLLKTFDRVELITYCLAIIIT